MGHKETSPLLNTTCTMRNPDFLNEHFDFNQYLNNFEQQAKESKNGWLPDDWDSDFAFWMVILISIMMSTYQIARVLHDMEAKILEKIDGLAIEKTQKEFVDA